MPKKPLILQLNIPFCFRKCNYCSTPTCAYDRKVLHAYAKAMIREIKAVAPDMEDYAVSAVSIEGGCPALMEVEDLQNVLQAARDAFNLTEDAFISLQTIPGEQSRSLMDRMRDRGVNHWVFGIPTADDEVHYLLNRPYHIDSVSMVDTVLKNFYPHDVSFDLLYGIPGQTFHSFITDLERMLKYAPEHMTIYPFRLEPGTDMARKVADGELKAAEADAMVQMYEEADRILKEAGYEPYTIYDYCRAGHENRYKTNQLAATEQLGIGYQAISNVDGVSYRNGHSLLEYIEHSTEPDVIIRDLVIPDDESVMKREIISGLTRTEGLDLKTLREKYAGLPAYEAFAAEIVPELIRDLRAAVVEENTLHLTPLGIISFWQGLWKS